MNPEIKYVILLKGGDKLEYVMSRHIRTSSLRSSNEKYVASTQVLSLAITFGNIEEANTFILRAELYKKHEVLICSYSCYKHCPDECIEILPFKMFIRKMKIDKIKRNLK